MAELVPLYDRGGDLRGWLMNNEHIFDVDLQWVAFVKSGHGFSIDGNRWLGPVADDGLCHDREGKPVLYGPRANVTPVPRPRPVPVSGPPFRPSPPAHPNKPPSPERPTTPAGGWSQCDFQGWLNQGLPAPDDLSPDDLSEPSAGGEEFDLFDDV